jgi:hypothetical protein
MLIVTSLFLWFLLPSRLTDRSAAVEVGRPLGVQQVDKEGHSVLSVIEAAALSGHERKLASIEPREGRGVTREEV